MIWEYLREDEFKEAVNKSAEVCVVPVGCVEKHGPHLPIGTDVIHATQIAQKAAQREPVVVFPTIYFGEKTGAGEFAGTIIFSKELRLQILEETCSEIHRNGFKKILLYSGHGGNTSMLEYFSRSVLYNKSDYMVFNYGVGTEYPTPKRLLSGNYGPLTADDRKILQECVDLKLSYGHACMVETGLIYATHPELVRIDKAFEESGKSTNRFDEFTKRRISTPFAWMANQPNSYDGDMHKGLNERIAAAMMEFSVRKLEQVLTFLKTETISDEYYKE